MRLATRRILIVGFAATSALASLGVPSSSLAEEAQPGVESHLSFQSLDGKTMLVAHLFRPPGDDPRPAVVMLHGCSGLLAKNGSMLGLYRAWAQKFFTQGYVVLAVNSAQPRGFGQTCSANEARKVMWRDRPKDAYAALRWLQAQPFVRPERIALAGWSQGGGVVLLSISDKSNGRPAGLANDFAAAVAF
jgi:dienelactone hydrolase